MKYNITVTDTFNGEANYCWVRRNTIEVPDALSKYALVRRVKQKIEWNGTRCLVVDYGDTVEIRPYGQCMVAFIEVAHEPAETANAG